VALDIAEIRRARTCVVGVGNSDLGDDGVGVWIAEALRDRGHRHAIPAGTTPEAWVGELSAGRFENVVFLDAVELDGEPGTAVILEAAELKARFPQVSTHRISLGTLAEVIERGARTRVLLLGVKPASLRAGRGLSRAVEATAEAVVEILLPEPRAELVNP